MRSAVVLVGGSVVVLVSRCGDVGEVVVVVGVVVGDTDLDSHCPSSSAAQGCRVAQN